MLRAVRHPRVLFLRIPAIMGLMFPLMACEVFQALDWGNPEPPAPVFIEPPAPEVMAEPQLEKPLPPLPASKPSMRQPQAQQEGAPNGRNGDRKSTRLNSSH